MKKLESIHVCLLNIKNFNFGESLKRLDEENYFFKWYDAQPIAAKVGFYGAAVIALLTHIVMYSTHILEEHSPGFSNARDFSASARWFAGWINRFSFYYSNWVTGLLQVLVLSLSVFIVVKAFNIVNKHHALLIAGIMVTFPAIAETNYYFHSAASVFFAAFLSIMGFYVTKLYKFGWIIGSFLLMLGLSIYQSKIGLAMVASIIWLIIFVVESNPKFVDFAKYASRYFLLIVGGLAAYMVSLEVVGIYELYRGPDRAAGLDVLQIVPMNLLFAYAGVYAYFFSTMHTVVPDIFPIAENGIIGMKIPSRFLMFSYGIVFFTGLLTLALSLKNIRKSVPNTIIVCLLALLLPVAGNFSRLFDTGHLSVLKMTAYPFVLFLALPLILWSNIKINVYGLKNLVCLALVFIIGYYVSFSNFMYLRGEAVTIRHLNFANRVAAQVEPLLPYSTDNQVFLIGNVWFNPLYPHKDDFLEYKPRAAFGHRLWGANEIGVSFQYIIGEVIRLHIGLDITQIGDNDREQYLLNRAITYGKPVWPQAGSVSLVDGVVVGILDFFGRVDVVEISPGNFSAKVNHTGMASDLEFEYVWYLYEDGRRLRQIFADAYGIGYLNIEINEPGLYQFRTFIRLQDGRDLLDNFSPHFLVK